MIEDVGLRYIGAKSLLLDEINDLLSKHITGEEESFVDLFAGTNVVGEYFKERYKIISNDLLFFSYCHAKAVIENNHPIKFSKLDVDPFVFFNDEKKIAKYSGDYYYAKNYTPLGEAMYFTEENGKRIDFIRNTIDEWNSENLLTEYEYYYLISCLIKAIPYISNTTGTYGAFLKHWDRRALKPLDFKPLKVLNNGRENKSYNKDSNQLVGELSADIVYIDTPYNNRQYASNYHVLENIALNTKPELNGITRIFDWQQKRSDYSTVRGALPAMKNLIANIDATHVILSYNDEGIITYEEMCELLRDNAIDNNLEIVEVPYRKYQSKISSKKANLNEYLFYFRKKDLEEKRIVSLKKPRTKTWKPKSHSFIKSPLNYIGGKYRLLNQIIALFPDDINVFLDLFSGGANVGINAKAQKYIFNDMNTRVNEMFKYFATQNTEELIEVIKSRIREYSLSKTNEKGFLQLRKDYNSNPNPLDLYTLVSYSYNYQLRFNNSMEFNNPFGRNRSSFSVNMENNLRKFNNKLKSINFEFTDYFFEKMDLSFLKPNDFVYMDPPYLITTGNYNDGNRGFQNWGEEQEKKLFEVMNRLTRKGVRFALSNVLEHKGKENTLLKDYIEREKVMVHRVNSSYRNSSYNTKNKGSKEVLITNYCPHTHVIFQ